MNLAVRARSVPRMASLSYDPFRAQARFAWQNRWTRWRLDGAQAAFHVVALLALALLLGVPAWQSRAAWGEAIGGTLRQWPMAVLFVAALAMTWQQTARLGALRTRASNDWLATQPVTRALRRRRVRDLLMGGAAAHALAGVLVLAAARADGAMFFAFLVAVAGAAGVAIPASRLVLHRRRVRAQQGSVIADRGVGRLWRWQRIACGVALRGRTLSLGAFALLAAPMDSGIGVTAVLGVAGISVALLSGAWRRSLRVLPQAHAWLAAQPLSPARLLRSTWAVPAIVLSLSVVAVGGVLLALGALPLAVAAVLALSSLGMLHFAATAAERAWPRRTGLVFLVHAMLLVGVVQSFPIAALPLWVAQMIFLLRRALR